MVHSKSSSRRHFLQQFGAAGTVVATRGALPVAATLPFSRVANAIDPATAIAIAQTTITVASELGVFGDKTGGMAQRYESINIRLDQILDNQELILGSIKAVNDSIEVLGEKVENLFQHDRFNEAYEEAEEIHTNIKNRVNDLHADPDLFKSANYYNDTFLSHSTTLQNAFTGLRRKLRENKMNNGGAPLAVKAVQSVFLLAEAQRMYARLEYGFSPNIARDRWVPHEFFKANLEIFDEIMDILSNNRMPEALVEQDAEIDKQRKIIDKTMFQLYVSDLLKKPAFESDSYVCFRSDDNIPPTRLSPGLIEGDDTMDRLMRNRSGAREIGKLSLSVATQSLFSQDRADIILKIDISGWEVAEEKLRLAYTRITSTELVPADFISGSTDQCVRISKKSLSGDVNNIKAQLESIKLPLARHAQAQAYKFVVLKLRPVVDNIKDHNRKMKDKFIPALEARHIERKNLTQPAPTPD